MISSSKNSWPQNGTYSLVATGPKVSFVANFTAEWNHEEHCAEEPFKHALAARPVCALTLAPRATDTFVQHMHSRANFPETVRPGHSWNAAAK